jgi:hypothetical protein
LIDVLKEFGPRNEVRALLSRWVPLLGPGPAGDEPVDVEAEVLDLG